MSGLRYIFVHGLAGWGSYDKKYERLPYWGMRCGDLIGYLWKQGFQAYAASVAPAGSAWDRACELYAQLAGLRTDYGAAHSAENCHERFGRDFSSCPLIPDWRKDTRLVLLGHSFGGTTSRLLSELLAAFPALARRQSDPPRVKEMTRRLVKTGTYVIFPCMAGLALISEPLVRLLLTEKWLPAVPYLRYYCLIYALWPVFTANLQAISAMGRSDIFLRLEVIKKALGVAILCVTLPMGLRAMMIGSCVNAVLGLFVNAAPNGRLMRYSFAELFADMAQPAVLTAIMAAGIRGAGWGTAAVLAGMERGGAHIPGGMSDFILIVVQIAAGMAVYLAASVLGRSENLRYLTGAVKEFAGRSARAEGEV